MYAYYINDYNESYALASDDGGVHIRLDEKDGSQARLLLTAEQARTMAARLTALADRTDGDVCQAGANFSMRRVVCAAIRNTVTKVIIPGPRHCFCRRLIAQLFPMGNQSRGFSEEGFIDQDGKFMTRKEALKVARKAGQIGASYLDKELYSSCLY